MNNIILIGRLTKEVELRYLPNTGTAMAYFTLAVDRNYKNKEGKKETDFINIKFSGKVAENIAKYVSKGSLVGVEGSLRIDRYEKDGEYKTFTNVFGRNIQFLDTKKSSENSHETFIPSLDPQGFQAIDDEDIPF